VNDCGGGYPSASALPRRAAQIRSILAAISPVGSFRVARAGRAQSCRPPRSMMSSTAASDKESPLRCRRSIGGLQFYALAWHDRPRVQATDRDLAAATAHSLQSYEAHVQTSKSYIFDRHPKSLQLPGSRCQPFRSRHTVVVGVMGLFPTRMVNVPARVVSRRTVLTGLAASFVSGAASAVRPPSSLPKRTRARCSPRRVPNPIPCPSSVRRPPQAGVRLPPRSFRRAIRGAGFFRHWSWAAWS